jgi:N-acetylated-alpha-linked acidic dipeptidase
MRRSIAGKAAGKAARPTAWTACTIALSVLPLLPFTAARAQSVFGYADFSQQAKWDSAFMAIPDPRLAGEELKELTKAPHWASSPEDHVTALYVAEKFKAAGLQTEIVPFRVWLNKPVKIEITAVDAAGHQLMSGPTPEHVDPTAYGGDPFQNDPRILPAFNGSSPSGDVTADVVYANFGTLEDFKRLAALGISVKGKIVIVRYGANFRGVKVYIAQQYGAAGVLIYSDPADDGYTRGDMYPRGPYRPPTGVQRGSVQFLPLYSGDPETPGVASTPELPDSQRITDPAKMNQPQIPSNPLSYHDAAPILQALDGPDSPRDWQGGLPFTYHLGGTGAVKVHMHLEQDYKIRTIWDVIGEIPGDDTTDWVVAGNHRDAWVFGAVDPNSGTAAMLEAVHGLGALLKQGWKPKRTMVICSWDAEEEGLVGSTEWAEMHGAELAHAVAYFNTDVGVSGPNFNASAVPSLKEFVRDVTRQVPSPKGGTVYEEWQKSQTENPRRRAGAATAINPFNAPSNSTITAEGVRVGDLGSGSDYTPFIQHLGVPSTDIGSDGPYGVYHSTFDDYTWFVKFADPTFVYEQQQARVFGLELLHMADADVLPYDYRLYGHEVVGYLAAAQARAAAANMQADFTAANAAAQRFASAGQGVYKLQASPATGVSLASLNTALRDAETALLNQQGLPKRPWYKHTIYAPGEYTGYAAVVIPGVNEGIDAVDNARTQSQLDALAAALNRSAAILEGATR